MMPQIRMDYELDRNDAIFTEWQSRVDRPMGNIHELAEWIHIHCTGHVTMGQDYIHFEIAKEAIFFKLAFDSHNE